LKFLSQILSLSFAGILLLCSCSTNTLESFDWENGKGFNVENGIISRNDKLFSGELIKKYENGIIHSKAEYTDGKLNGQFESWSSNGNLIESRFYTKGVKTGFHKGWWSNSKPKFTYSFNDQGQYEGQLLEWSESGRQFKIMNFKNGKEAGHQRIWDEDGNIKCNYTAINGDRFGLVNMKNCYSVDNENSKINM
jgi:antitoxin component YwqK of YwqJK toxin-antitoxin module